MAFYALSSHQHMALKLLTSRTSGQATELVPVRHKDVPAEGLNFHDFPYSKPLSNHMLESMVKEGAVLAFTSNDCMCQQLVHTPMMSPLLFHFQI